MYYLLYSICYLFSLLPFWILYRISDLFYLLLYHIIRYRRKIVRENLQLSFPEKNKKDIISIEKKYYRNLTDMIVEMIKMATISKSQLKKRLAIDLTPLNELYQQRKNCLVLLGHCFNWEWANLRNKIEAEADCVVVYQPISNKAFEKLMTKIRTRFGTILMATNEVQTPSRQRGKNPYISILVADQNPPVLRRAYWVPFLNRMTAFYKGPELTARRENVPVFFFDIKKIRRGYYQASLQLIFEQPQWEAEGMITERFAQLLEKSIREQPEIWVWSHRRWKHKFPASNMAG